MLFAPVRIMRETIRVEASSLHWVEKVGYKVIFSLEKGEDGVVEDMLQYIESSIKVYEKETYKLRMKAYEEVTKGK